MSEEVKTSEEYMLYLDNIGRLHMGKKIVEKSQGDTILVKNPVIIHISSTNQGGINIQFFPVMFREFQADKNESSSWPYNKTNITPCNPITLDARLIGQYEQIFAPIKNMQPVNDGSRPVQMPMGGQAPAPMGSQPANVIKLFDE